MATTKPRSLQDLPLEAVEGIGPKLAKVLADMGLVSVTDLLEHYPHRYLDLSTVKEIGHVREGDEVTVVGEVKDVQRRGARFGRTRVLNVTVFDGTGYISGVWFNQDWIEGKLPPGTTVAFSGRAVWRFNQLQIQNPFYDVLDEEQRGAGVHAGRIIPIHPATAKVSAARIRRLVRVALDRFLPEVKEVLPADLRDRYGLMTIDEALGQIHFPAGREALGAARKRLIFDEFFRLELGLALRKCYLADKATGISHKVSGRLLNNFYAALPWRLTADQQRALKDIKADMAAPRPMHRLLLGEVGSGKTVVAAAAMLMAVESGYQAALMAPTEVLAEQHYIKLREPLEALGLKVVLILGGQTAATRRGARAAVVAGDIDIVIGTHSLVQEKVDFARLGLVVIDEQHRFGVRQRLDLRAKGDSPDMLVLTATPIPRTLAMTLYGDLDISMLTERPGGRTVAGHVSTKYISEGRREQAYKLIRREVAAGRRAFIVCPLIDESDKLEVKSVLQEAEQLKNNVFSDLRVGLLHGRMPSVEKEAVMRSFRSGELEILIATTVIEVGIDVPEATVMLIEHAERFGLSQLHQLRGRVGRGEWKSYCLLTGNIKTDDAKARVKAIMEISDGFALAEADLAIRGEGQLFGLRQSGLPDLKLAKLTKHAKALETARREAFALIEADPMLAKPRHKALKSELRRRFAGNLE
ncbi:MAG: ATP-dependent DNA helicase RecG, partial [Actinomycetota bacterium]|nr:ATP-dependent DNA helicase RecG [Actinomycetota bacterium]